MYVIYRVIIRQDEVLQIHVFRNQNFSKEKQKTKEGIIKVSQGTRM